MLPALHTGGHKPTSLLYNFKCLFYWGVFTEEVLVSFGRTAALVFVLVQALAEYLQLNPECYTSYIFSIHKD